MKILLLFLSLTTLSFSALANCNQKEADKGMSSAMQECANDLYQRTDKKLNVTYQAIVKKLKDRALNPSEKETANSMLMDLRNSQRDWIKFRDSECARTTGINIPDSGRETQLLYSYCPTNMTEERIKTLTVKCEEGDISCIDYE